jgi:hypothetical protein
MNRNSLGKWVEISWPWLAAIAAGTSGLILNQRVHLTPEITAKLLDKFVDVCAISVGFWSTALALLLALEERRTVEVLRQAGIYTRIVEFFLTTVYSYFLLLVCCLVTIAVGHPTWIRHDIYVAAWASILVFSASATLRSFLLLGKLLKAK